MAGVGLREDWRIDIAGSNGSLMRPAAILLVASCRRRRSLGRHLLGQEAAGLARP